jgi:MFS transporter, YNFM family, putative membrane transport protein
MHASSGSVPIRTLIFLAAASFASAASLRAGDPILPEIANAFLTTPGDAARIITFFGAAYAVAQFVYGFIGDRYGLLRVITVTTLVSGVSTLACAAAGSLDLLVVARSAVGLTAAAIIPLSFAWIGGVIAYERRQPVLAYFISGQISGIVLGQAFAGIIAEHFGWRFVFVAIAALFAVAGVALLVELRRRGDEAGAAQALSGSPLVRLREMLRRPWVVIVLVSAFFEGMLFFGAYTFVGSYLWARFGLSLDIVGLIVAGFGIGGLIYAATAARMLPRLGEPGLVLWGGLLVAISFAAITIAPLPGMVVLATILAGFSYYMIHNTLQTHATQMAPDTRGLAVATFASCLFLGQAVGVGLAAPVFDLVGGRPIFLAAGASLLLFGAIYRALLLRRD